MKNVCKQKVNMGGANPYKLRDNSMQKKGFTLIELLGVLIILSAIVLIVFPSILNQVKKSKVKINEATKLVISSATSLYLEENQNKYGYIKGDTYCITLRSLVEKGKLQAPIKDQSGKEIDLDTFVKANVIQERNISYELAEECSEKNTTPSIPDEPEIVPDENSKAPVIEFTSSNFLSDTETTFDALEGVLITDDNTPRSEIKVTVIGEVSLGIIGKYPIVYEAVDKDSNVTTATRVIEILKKEYVFSYTGSYQQFVVPRDGKYKIELWGASGGNPYLNGVYDTREGYGGYTSGEIELEKNRSLYFYVGGAGRNGIGNSAVAGGYNGGGNGTYTTSWSGGSGGGATDVRYFDDTPTNANLTWNSVLGLRSRIMVAAGGGGSGASWTAGSGGGLAGENKCTHPEGLSECSSRAGEFGTPGTQTTGNAFGYGQSATGSCHKGGAGGGYYGGIISSACYGGSGGGGSSYISGYLGCVAVTSKDSTSPKSGCANGTTDITCSYHYSGYIFKNGVMISGYSQMPTYDGTGTMNGNNGNGYAKITILLD